LSPRYLLLFLFAFKELRRKWGYALVCGLSLLISSISVLLLLSISSSYYREINLHTKELLGADFIVSSRIRPSEYAMSQLRTIAGFESELIQTNTMLAVGDEPHRRFRIAQVRGIDEQYPIYGSVRSDPNIELLANSNDAILEDSLARQLKLNLGDLISIGREKFIFKGTLVSAPGEVSIVGMVAPRVYVSIDKLRASGLLEFGSQARYRYLFRGELPSQELKTRLSNLQFEVETFSDRASSAGRITDALEKMLKFVAILVLTLGVVGYSVALQFDLTRRVNSLKSLYLLGVNPSQFQVCLGFGALLISILVFVTCGIISSIALPLLQDGISAFTPLVIPLQIDWSAYTFIAGLGILITLWNAVVLDLAPLTQSKSSGSLRILAGTTVPALITLIGFSIFFGDLSSPLKILVGLLIGSSLIFLLTRLLAYIFEQSVAKFSTAIKFAVLMFARRQSYYLLSIITLTLSTTVVLSTAQFKDSILEQLRQLTSGEKPNSFLFDVQGNQVEDVYSLSERHQIKISSKVPVITMRLLKIDGESISNNSNSKRATWALKREYRTTYRGELQGSEEIIDGKFVESTTESIAPISIEEKMASDLDVTLGSKLTFGIQGIPVETIVSSIRKVDWKSGDINFFITFPKGILETAPHYYALLTQFQRQDQFLNFQNELNEKFPNVSVIDLRELFNGVEFLLNAIGRIATSLAIIVFHLALAILATALLGLTASKLKILSILRLLGASRKFKFKILLAENLLIAVLGIGLGVLFSFAFSEGIIVNQMSLPRYFDWARIMRDVGVLLIFPLVLGVGLGWFQKASD
jgi:putative ABC transport system permease protein